MLCIIKSITYQNDFAKSLLYFILDNVITPMSKNFICRFIMNKLLCMIKYYDSEYDYYLEYPFNNRILKGIYTCNKLCDIIMNF